MDKGTINGDAKLVVKKGQRKAKRDMKNRMGCKTEYEGKKEE